MHQDLTEDQKRLADLMSDISENAYSAQWMRNLEYVLWDAVVNGERKFGFYLIDQKDIDKLIALSELTNSWVYFDDDTGETAVSIELWRKRFEKDIRHSPNLING